LISNKTSFVKGLQVGQMEDKIPYGDEASLLTALHSLDDWELRRIFESGTKAKQSRPDNLMSLDEFMEWANDQPGWALAMDDLRIAKKAIEQSERIRKAIKAGNREPNDADIRALRFHIQILRNSYYNEFTGGY